MIINRRTALEGFAAFLATGGVVSLASAAAEVDRSDAVRVEFVADDMANFQIRPAIDHPSIDFEETDTGIGMAIDRVNRAATTRFEDLIEYTNNGSNVVTDISTSVDDVDGPAELEVEAFVDMPIEPGQSKTGLAFIIHMQNPDGEAEVEATITIRVDTDA